MPIYLYECDSCGARFERLQRMSDEPLSVCVACSGRVRRIIQPVGVIFRGSGFYVTDNRQGSSSTLKPSKDPEGATGKDGASEAEPKAEPVPSDGAASKEPTEPGARTQQPKPSVPG